MKSIAKSRICKDLQYREKGLLCSYKIEERGLKIFSQKGNEERYKNNKKGY